MYKHSYYQSSSTGKIATDFDIAWLKSFIGFDAYDKLLKHISVRCVPAPSPRVILEASNCKNKATALIRYRELHPEATLKESQEAINRLLDMIRSSKDT